MMSIVHTPYSPNCYLVTIKFKLIESNLFQI